MPCYQVRTTTLALEAANIDLLAAALNAIGIKATVRGQQIDLLVPSTGATGYWRGNALVLSGNTVLDVEAVKREYSRQAIIAQAKQRGWQLRFRPNGQIEVAKRRFA